jgi:Flp pilus assembly protein TadG
LPGHSADAESYAADILNYALRIINFYGNVLLKENKTGIERPRPAGSFRSGLRIVNDLASRIRVRRTGEGADMACGLWNFPSSVCSVLGRAAIGSGGFILSCRFVRRLLGDKRGATAIMTAIAATTVMGFAGVAVDVGYWQTTQRRMQGVADEAAFAAAMANYKGAGGTATCPSGTASGIPCTTADAVAHDLGFANGTNDVTVTVNNPPSSGSDNNAYEVIISQPQPMWFGNFFLSSAPTTTERAVAAPNPTTGPACVMSLRTTGQDDIIASGSAIVNLSTCDVVDNSSDAKALEGTGGGLSPRRTPTLSATTTATCRSAARSRPERALSPTRMRTERRRR